MIKPKTPNSMEIAGQPAVINYVPELNAFRGKFWDYQDIAILFPIAFKGYNRRARYHYRNILLIVVKRASSLMLSRKS